MRMRASVIHSLNAQPTLSESNTYIYQYGNVRFGEGHESKRILSVLVNLVQRRYGSRVKLTQSRLHFYMLHW